LAKFKESQVQQKEEMKEDHDNRIQNQGPVGLQVQEPVLHKEVAWKDDNNNKKLDNNPNVDAQVRTFCGEKKWYSLGNQKTFCKKNFN
jgi:hypothetical protein